MCGVQCDNTHSFFEAFNVWPDLFDDTCQFMPKQCRRHNHPGMVATLVHLQIGTAGQSYLHLDQHFPFVQLRDRHLLNLHVLFAVEDGCCHVSVHSMNPSMRCPVE